MINKPSFYLNIAVYSDIIGYLNIIGYVLGIFKQFKRDRDLKKLEKRFKITLDSFLFLLIRPSQAI